MTANPQLSAETEATIREIERLAGELADVTRQGTDLLEKLVAAEKRLRDSYEAQA